MEQITIPTEPNDRGATINANLVAKAAAELNIARPIIIEWRSYKLFTGHYYAVHATGGVLSDDDSSDYYHRIRVADHLWPGELSITLWHELTHASQSERFPSFCAYYWAYEEEKERAGYEDSIFEQEARYWSQAHPFCLTCDDLNRSFTGTEPSPLAKRIEELWLTA